MRRRITDELTWLQRAAGIPLHTEGLRKGRQCLVCRCWKKPCERCRQAAETPAPVAVARPDLDEHIRRMLLREKRAAPSRSAA